MPTPPLKQSTCKRTAEAFIRNGRNVTHTALELGISRQQVNYHLARLATPIEAIEEQPQTIGSVATLHETARTFPKTDGVQRFILTTAQNNTHIFAPFWVNLMALKRFWGAELLVSRCTYNKSAFGPKSRKPGTGDTSDNEELWYDSAVLPYICDERVQLADDLVFCGELNLSPTLVHPISGWETYTGANSCILPHAKIAMRSVPTTKHKPAKFVYTTGACTLRNYVQRSVGQKADFHHAFGALLVEIDDGGTWFARQLNADSDGTVYDWDLRAKGGNVTGGHRLEAINWGDTHLSFRDDELYRLAWGHGGILDTARPRYQFFHDLSDGRSHNPHVEKYGLVHEKFRNWVDGYSSVEGEIDEVAHFLKQDATREWCETVIVHSNHHRFLDTWMQRHDYRKDPSSAIFFLEMQLAIYRHYMEAPEKPFNIFRHALDRAFREIEVTANILGVTVLDRDESFIICDDANGGIECGMHGDDGPNGARGTPANISRIGCKSNTGHTHGAAIQDGACVAGVFALMDHRYNNGPSSWSPSNIGTYENGKRFIFTIKNGKFRA